MNVPRSKNRAIQANVAMFLRVLIATSRRSGQLRDVTKRLDF